MIDLGTAFSFTYKIAHSFHPDCFCVQHLLYIAFWVCALNTWVEKEQLWMKFLESQSGLVYVTGLIIQLMFVRTDKCKRSLESLRIAHEILAFLIKKWAILFLIFLKFQHDNCWRKLLKVFVSSRFGDRFDPCNLSV